MNADDYRWIALYFSVPVVLVAAVRAHNRIKLASLPSPFEGQTAITSAAVVVTVLTLWPLVIVGLVLDPWIQIVRNISANRKARFNCLPEHLLEIESIAAAEASAFVTDLMKRVPNVPFGHQNASWLEFKRKKKSWYQLRAFSIPGIPKRQNGPQWSTPRGQKLGYAWVRFGRIKAEFLYEWD